MARFEQGWETWENAWYNDDEKPISEKEYEKLVKEAERLQKEKDRIEANQNDLKYAHSYWKNAKENVKFHDALIKWQKTKSEEDWDVIETAIYVYGKKLSNKYIRALPLRTKQLFLYEVNLTEDNEFITELMWEAVTTWKPNTHSKNNNVAVVTFWTYYKTIVKNYAIDLIRKTNAKFREGIILMSLDSENGMQTINEVSMKLFNIGEHHLTFDVHLMKFINHLRLINKELPKFLGLLYCELYSYSAIGLLMNCSTKTVQRKVEQIKKEWKNYNLI